MTKEELYKIIGKEDPLLYKKYLSDSTNYYDDIDFGDDEYETMFHQGFDFGIDFCLKYLKKEK